MRLFRRVAATAALMCAVLSLSGCQPAISLYLINHTGRTIQVLHSAGRWQDRQGVVNVEPWDRFWAWPFLIDRGVGRRVDYARGSEWILEVRMARCRLRYEAPMGVRSSLYENGAWRAFDHTPYAITTQFESDGRLYLVAAPESENNRPRAVDITPFIAIQPEGFPVEPSSRVCPRR